VDESRQSRLSDAELRALFDRLFPHGFAGSDVVAEIAHDGWEQSLRVECFPPSVHCVFDVRTTADRDLDV